MCKPALVWLVSDVMKRSWQAESSHSRCSPTLPAPGANAPTQMPAQATGRGDKTHQVTLPFWMVPTFSCHRCEMPSCQTLMVTDGDRHLFQGTTCAVELSNWCSRYQLVATSQRKQSHKYRVRLSLIFLRGR